MNLGLLKSRFLSSYQSELETVSAKSDGAKSLVEKVTSGEYTNPEEFQTDSQMPNLTPFNIEPIPMPFGQRFSQRLKTVFGIHRFHLIAICIIAEVQIPRLKLHGPNSTGFELLKRLQ